MGKRVKTTVRVCVGLLAVAGLYLLVWLSGNL